MPGYGGHGLPPVSRGQAAAVRAGRRRGWRGSGGGACAFSAGARGRPGGRFWAGGDVRRGGWAGFGGGAGGRAPAPGGARPAAGPTPGSCFWERGPFLG